MRAAASTALAVLPLVQPATARAADTGPRTLPIGVAVGSLTLADESRTGYDRTLFRHWTAGADPADDCDTRREVLIAEAVDAPAIGPRCTLTGGRWVSYYDGRTVTAAGALDIDHMVPLAEAWDSGASAWTPARREAYANDQEQASSLVAVTARSNRQKGDKDPAEWLPSAEQDRCRYTAEWTATKLRWNLTADPTERQALRGLALGCPSTTVTYKAAAQER
ncbi:HNH endonuclease family protein [Streptomyces sp. NPDC058417]|uniref:HNH endonuclease family protein n=1 Tax=unclassified Streptomyces TaxID=2593676 RepID=UPI00364C977E